MKCREYERRRDSVKGNLQGSLSVQPASAAPLTFGVEDLYYSLDERWMISWRLGPVETSVMGTPMRDSKKST